MKHCGHKTRNLECTDCKLITITIDNYYYQQMIQAIDFLYDKYGDEKFFELFEHIIYNTLGDEKK